LDYAWIVRAQLGASRHTREALADGPGTPVLLLPGVYETWGVMAGLASTLHAAGHPVHTVPALGVNVGPLEESARVVAARIEELGLVGVVLVAHSKGGLIGRLVMDDAPGADRVAGMVAVGTPFAGSSMARLLPNRAVRDLSPSDPTIRALALAGGNDRISSLYPTFDPHIPEGSVLRGGVNVELPIDGHFRVLGDTRVHALVLDQIQRLVPGP
jgi:pimeloyl-ACP methyl ester carboxylesterase